MTILLCACSGGSAAVEPPPVDAASSTSSFVDKVSEPPPIAPSSSVSRRPTTLTAGRLYFDDDGLLERRPALDGYVHFIPSISKDHTLVADIVTQDDAMEVLFPQQLLVRRLSDDAEVHRFDISTKVSYELEIANDEAARAEPVKRMRAAVDAANAWLGQHEWTALERCGGPLIGDHGRKQPSEIACRERAKVVELAFLRPSEDLLSPPSVPPTLMISRAKGQPLKRAVSRWFPWFTNDEWVHCRWPEVEAWARPDLDGPLIVFTFVQVGGACAEPMSDFHVLAMPP